MHLEKKSSLRVSIVKKYSIAMKFFLIVFILLLILPGVSAQNKKEPAFTLISSEQGKLPKEDAVYSYEITTSFSLKKPPAYFHKTEHVTWTKEESPVSNFLKEKPGQKLYFDVAAVSGSYNATDVQNKGKKLSYSTNRTLTSSESDQLFGSSELIRTASGAVLLISIPNITTWAPFSGSDNQPTECAHVGSYGDAKYAYQFSFTEAELRKWDDVKKNWQASCKLDPDYNSGDFSSSVKMRVTLNYLAEEKPSLLLAGCESLIVGETGSLTATAKPSSGTYRYWSEGNEVSISGSDAQAKITANAPGKTKVWVEYTTPKGEQIKESKTIYAIKLNSINDGNPLQIGLYDVKGKPTKGIKPVPVAVEPASGEYTKI